MAHHVTSQDIPADGEKVAAKDLSKVKMISLAVFILGAIASGLLFTNKTWGSGFAYSWLFAFIFFITLTLGGVFWTTRQSVSVPEVSAPSLATTVTHHSWPFTVALAGMEVSPPSM